MRDKKKIIKFVEIGSIMAAARKNAELLKTFYELDAILYDPSFDRDLVVNKMASIKKVIHRHFDNKGILDEFDIPSLMRWTEIRGEL